MKKIILNILVVFVGMAMLQQAVEASTLTSRVKTLRVNKNVLSPARTSVELFSTVAGPCSGNWYAFDNANTGVGKNMTEILVAAVQSGRTVMVQGTGVCDSFGIEKVEFIDIK